MLTTAHLRPGDLILATVKLRPSTIELRPELVRYNGLRSTFLATFVYSSGSRIGEFALAHESWSFNFLPSGDVSDIELSAEDPFADDTIDYVHEDTIDFLECSDTPESGSGLRRCDLAELRFAIANPGYDTAWVSKASLERLIAHGMLEQCCDLIYATAHGIRTARANTSCRSGCEGQPMPPGAWRQALHDVGRQA
jgi:hypothetical protein